jgi:PAS domain-containing protein
VTAQFEAQRRAELHARQLEIAARVGGVSHWSIELATQKVFWSPGIYPLHGVTPETYTPELTSAINFYHTDDRQRVTDLVDAAIRKAEPFEFVATLVRADGIEQRVHSACEVTTDPTGKVDSVVGVIRPLD